MRPSQAFLALIAGITLVSLRALISPAVGASLPTAGNDLPEGPRPEVEQPLDRPPDMTSELIEKGLPLVPTHRRRVITATAQADHCGSRGGSGKCFCCSRQRQQECACFAYRDLLLEMHSTH